MQHPDTLQGRTGPWAFSYRDKDVRANQGLVGPRRYAYLAPAVHQAARQREARGAVR